MRVICSLCIFFSIFSNAQDTTNQSGLSWDFLVDVYFSYDLSKPPDHQKPFFLYNYNRHNEFNVNLVYVRGRYNAPRTRASVALASGTYMNSNYAAEPGVLKNIYEANVGLRISKKRNLWVDAGIFSSHIGFETAHSPDCWTLTRSIVAENSPYFESGARLTYTSFNDKLTLSALALNGWQRITRINGNSLLSWGTQVYIKHSDKLTFNYSTFFGTDKADSVRLWRTYHNLYVIFQLSTEFGLIAGFDIGTEQSKAGNNAQNTWYTWIGILRFKPNLNWAIAIRSEYFCDENGVLISTGTPSGFKTFGTSVNVDKNITDHLLWRVEFRIFNSRDAIFKKNNSFKRTNSEVTTSIALIF